MIQVEGISETEEVSIEEISEGVYKVFNPQAINDSGVVVYFYEISGGIWECEACKNGPECKHIQAVKARLKGSSSPALRDARVLPESLLKEIAALASQRFAKEVKSQGWGSVLLPKDGSDVYNSADVRRILEVFFELQPGF